MITNAVQFASGAYDTPEAPGYVLTSGSWTPEADRKWEIDAGVIQHALAVAFDYPSSEFVSPATGSDGLGLRMDSPTVSTTGYDPPEGAFLRLKPSIDIATKYMGTARILAQALRDYGACIIDNSGRPKLYAEYGVTAGWGSIEMGSAAAQIAMSDLEVIDWAPGVAPPATPPDRRRNHASHVRQGHRPFRPHRR